MPSILSGFEYDIFISYRHNDNLDGWVTNFVQNLEKELKGTLKDEVSIYFDRNPHNGLLETHNVDKSLEGKLKCLIFIPIISQTYCDPKSFAWQHEFCAFNNSSKADQFGRDIKLSNGNVASRILPIKIHNLDAEDKALLESELGGVLRAVEFIYKEAGVNRPLIADDREEKNLNGTRYRNQVNKTAGAIKELIVGIQHAKALPKDDSLQKAYAPKSSRGKIALATALIAVLSLASFGYFFGAFGNKIDVTVEKSIAVLPFVNMSNDPEQEYFSDGISEEVLNLLAKVPELKVTGRTSSFYFKGKNEDLRMIGQKLGVANLLEGSVRKDGDQIRITAQLIRTSDGTHLWSETYDRKLEGIFKLQDEIAAAVLKELKLKILGLPSTAAKNNEAHNLLLKGKYAFYNFDLGGATEFYQQALALDSTNADIWTSLSTIKFLMTYGDFKHREENFHAAKHCAEKALALDNNFSDAHRAKGFANMFDGDWDGAESEYNQALKLDPNNSEACRTIGILKMAMGRSKEALPYAIKSVELSPLNLRNLSLKVSVYQALGDYEQAATIINDASAMNPEWSKYSMMWYYIELYKPQLALKLLNELGLPEGNEKIKLMVLINYELGKKNEALTLVNKMLEGYNDYSYDIARIFAFMNRKDETFKWLERAYEERFRIFNIKSDPAFSNLRNDSRYTEILKRMHLPLN